MQCKYCGADGTHLPNCPVMHQGTEKTNVPELSREDRIAAARRHLADHVAAQRKEIGGDVRSRERSRTGGRRINANDIAEAREILMEQFEAGDLPKVTVAREHLKSILEKGLREMPTAYQKSVIAIVGTIGREPLLNNGDDRVILELNIKPEELSPRFTGPEKLFEGVVGINKPVVPPEQIRVIDPKAAPEQDNVARAA